MHVFGVSKASTGTRLKRHGATWKDLLWRSSLDCLWGLLQAALPHGTTMRTPSHDHTLLTPTHTRSRPQARELPGKLEAVFGSPAYTHTADLTSPLHCSILFHLECHQQQQRTTHHASSSSSSSWTSSSSSSPPPPSSSRLLVLPSSPPPPPPTMQTTSERPHKAVEWSSGCTT